MSNQEMQFADPDWKPSQQLNNKTNSQEQEEYTAQPINADYREQNQWRAAPPSPPQQEGYTGLRPYAGPAPQQMQGGNFRQRPYRRRGRGPWFWIILALIIIAMTSGGFRSFNGPSFDHNPFNQRQIVGKPITYTVTGQQPNIVINNSHGNVLVNVGQSNTVIIQAVNESNPFGNPNAIQPVSSQEVNTITASIPDSQPGSADLQVTVPQGADLNIKTDSGDISINGVDGQMTLTTSGGNINASNDVISGQSTMTSNAGNINFDGTFGTGGSYQFQTKSDGSVDLTVPTALAFHVEASTTSGTIDIPGVHGSDTKASGDVGVSSHVQGTGVNINTDSGDIHLHQR